MIKIKHIKATNFYSFETLEYKIKSNKLDLIIGNNSCLIDKSTSSGSGKSSLIDAIYFSIEGKSIRGVTNGKIIRRGCDSSTIEMSYYDSDNQEHAVRRVLKKSTQEVFLDGIKTPSNDYANDIIKSHIGLNFPDAIKMFFVVSKSSYKSFFLMPESEKEKYIFESNQNFPLFAEYESICKTNISNLTVATDMTQKSILSIKNKILAEKAKIVNDVFEDLDSLKEKRSKSLEEIANLRSKFEASFSDMKKLLKLSNEGSGVMQEIANTLSRLNNSLNGKVECPECKHIFIKNSDKKIEDVEKEIKEANERGLRVKAKVADIDSQCKSKKQEQDEIDREIKRLNGEIAKLNLTLEKEKKKSENEKVEAAIKSLEEFCLENEKSLEVINGDLSDYLLLKEAIKACKIKIKKIEAEELTEIVNSKVEKIMGITIKINVSKDGKDGEKSDTSVKIFKDFGEFDYKELSNGERMRLDIAFMMAKREQFVNRGSGIDLFILDEIIESGDQQNIKNIFDLIREEEITSIVITHGKSSDFDGEKTVICKNNDNISYIK